MVDIHCHILPGVDDGPKSWEVSEEMCRMAAADGIEHIVATPHANERFAYDRECLEKTLDTLRQRVASMAGARAPQLGLGCDFHFSYENLQDALIRPAQYTIEGSRYLLVELSNYSIPPQVERQLAQLAEAGLTPVITHPERNPILQRTPERVLRWVELGCAVQVTAAVMTGSWGELAVRAAQWLLKRDAVHVLATDAHDTRHRVPILSKAAEAVQENYGNDLADALVAANPRAIIQGEPLPYYPAPVFKV